MDDKTQKETEGKAAEEDQAQTKAQGNDDTQNRNPAEDTPEESSGPDKIELANQASERLEKATAAQRKENDRSEKIEAARIASGKGQMIPKKAEAEETPVEYKNRVMKGE